MKRVLLSLLLVLTGSLAANALSYNDARERAWFLTDKMAYELNLNPEQYDVVYQVNLEYFLQVNSPSDCTGRYWRYRNTDLRYILFGEEGVLIARVGEVYDQLYKRQILYNWGSRNRHKPLFLRGFSDKST